MNKCPFNDKNCKYQCFLQSQDGQDDFVLKYYKTGFFCDVGACDGLHCSNTLKLELLGWTGICIEPFPTNFETRKCIVEKSIVFSEKDKEIEFKYYEKQKGLSGITETLHGWSEHIVKNNSKSIILKTKILENILDQYNAPKFIEFLSLDTEGSEYEILKTFPFNKYSFGIIIVEHNHDEKKRSNIFNILTLNGYKKIHDYKNDDYYLNIK